jgi:Family of unknown function (DUF6159)
MFESLTRSWEYAKISYSVIWENKQLVIFPIISSIATILVMASFLVPLWSTGTIERMTSDDPANALSDAALYSILFAFYFCNYFVIVFFNSALTACAMRVINGEQPSVADGLAVATRRLPQILAWAFVSAIVGVILQAIENANEKAGRFISAILGSAWTAMTYFVIPVIVVDGVGPVEAFKRSLGTLKNQWGTALVGGFSLGFLGLLVIIPVALVGGGLIWLATQSMGTPGLIAAIAAATVLFAIGMAVNSAAGVVFKALLFNFATNRSLPQGINASHFGDAFVSKD